jgi:hypothetical protein
MTLDTDRKPREAMVRPCEVAAKAICAATDYPAHGWADWMDEATAAAEAFRALSFLNDAGLEALRFEQENPRSLATLWDRVTRSSAEAKNTDKS